ncbi:hypothetical protein [Paludisphaera rhizosphaerae]|uniref:hypothetical protein n=1 Tax=Paludisphaera rhizosphaerae TaxID=2711216 RepID=UPI0013EBD669|nr:hypothetical protein [Paludisphaera rhizosphaerae]
MQPWLPRIRRRSCTGLIAVAALCGTASTVSLRAEEPPRPATGRVSLASGRAIDYTVHLDRNSLQDALQVGNGLIALTSSGALLRFDRSEVRPDRERVDVAQFVCLGRGEDGSVYAGLDDGRVCRVDPTTLELTEVAKLPSAPRWIGWRPASTGRSAGLVAVISATRHVEDEGRRYEVGYTIVHDLAAGRTFKLLSNWPTTFLLDHRSRLWLGTDRGEWGGSVERLDLIGGAVDSLGQESWDGVYGFVELRDGQVWAFCGTTHLGSRRSAITRVDGEKPERLFTLHPPPADPRQPADPNDPKMPITHIVEEDDGLLVLSYSDVFRVDRGLKNWKRVAELKLRYRGGHPYAMGLYPAVRTIDPPVRHGEPYVLATVGNGVVLLDDEKATPHKLLGQLGSSWISRIENTTEGTLFLESDDRLPAWKLGENGWAVADLAPPFAADPASPYEASQGRWSETHTLVTANGAIYTISGTSGTGTRTTARRANGRSERIGRETSWLFPGNSFVTRDGTLWNAFSGLTRFEQGRWQPVGRTGEGESEAFPTLRAIDLKGPPWFLVDASGEGGDLWRLVPGPRREDVRLTRQAIGLGPTTPQVYDALPLSGGSLLLATDVGLRNYKPASGEISPSVFPGPSAPVIAIARDGLGRLWLGNDRGLWLSEAGAKAAETFETVPWVGRGEILDLAPDPQHPDGVIAALGSRGVAFLRAFAKP